jgi:hypothetical protein
MPGLGTPSLPPHTAPGPIRTMAGWALVGTGGVLFFLPIPLGLLMILIGIALLGPNNRLLRQLAARFMRSVRRWSRSRWSWVRGVGRRLRAGMRALRQKLRGVHRRRAIEQDGPA